MDTETRSRLDRLEGQMRKLRIRDTAQLQSDKIITSTGVSPPSTGGAFNLLPGFLPYTFPNFSQGQPSIGRIFMFRLIPQVTVTVTQILWVVAVAATAPTLDQVDGGVYDSNGANRLASAGLTAPGTGTGLKTLPLTSSLRLTAGTVYYPAFLYSLKSSTNASVTYSFSVTSTAMFGMFGITPPNAIVAISDGWGGSALPASTATNPPTSAGLSTFGVWFGLV